MLKAARASLAILLMCACADADGGSAVGVQAGDTTGAADTVATGDGAGAEDTATATATDTATDTDTDTAKDTAKDIAGVGDDLIEPGDSADSGDLGQESDVAQLPGACSAAGTPAATAACLSPTQTPEYYVDQALAYFDTLDVDADPLNIPAYGELVIRWEWPPWLRLTGYGRQVLIDTAAILRQFDPSTVPLRDCRYFPVQPFARCVVTFEYEGGPCPIYEEFIFNDDGEMTFIEAWSDVPGLRPISAQDPWGEAPGFARLGTRVPGLGYGDGRVDLESPALVAAAKADDDIAALVERAANFWDTWLAELNAADETDFFAIGCGW